VSESIAPLILPGVEFAFNKFDGTVCIIASEHGIKLSDEGSERVRDWLIAATLGTTHQIVPTAEMSNAAYHAYMEIKGNWSWHDVFVKMWEAALAVSPKEQT
jgi:hypothetical protein